jgi:hypothetical protein
MPDAGFGAPKKKKKTGMPQGTATATVGKKNPNLKNKAIFAARDVMVHLATQGKKDAAAIKGAKDKFLAGSSLTGSATPQTYALYKQRMAKLHKNWTESDFKKGWDKMVALTKGKK